MSVRSLVQTKSVCGVRYSIDPERMNVKCPIASKKVFCTKGRLEKNFKKMIAHP